MRSLGLGLSIVDSIARAHGGAITPTADPAGGLAVRVDFSDATRPGPARLDLT